MGTGPIAHPFRLAANGNVLTRAAGSADDVNDRISLIVETVQGERPMFESFGIPDPVFVGISAGDVQACIREYGPENVVIEDFELEPLDARISSVHIKWSLEESGEDEDEGDDEGPGEFDAYDNDDYEDDEE